MADVAKPKAEENQENDESGNESEEVETSTKDKKGAGDKKKKNAVSASAAKIKPPAKKRVKAEQAEENKKEKDKKKKPAAKAKDEEEDGEDEEDGDEGSEGEENGVPDKAVPLLDQPLEITGSRERKQVDRFIPKEESKGDADKKVEIPDGKGKPLGEIPRIHYEITKLKSENLKILHRVLYNRVGQPHMIKKNISQFKGFDFDKDSPEYKKKQTVLLKLKNAVLKELCTILDLAKSGKHAELGDRVLDFLLKPEDSGKAPPDPRPKRKGISSKTYTEPKTEEETKKSKAKNLSKKKAKSSEDEEDEPMDEEEDEKKTEDEEDNESVGSEEEKPKKGATKRAPPKKTATAAAKKRAPPAGGGVANKKAKEKEKSESESEHQSETEEDDKEAPAKKNKNPPTDDEIKSYVKSVLEGANLEEITMKTVCKKVYENYPEFDLGHKRDFIKNTVKSLISS